ncbi:MAG: putative serine:threonine protein kinase ULK2 [Streblomastix strix]|uniref:Putative serine:threonine protein kinase ULK2 n=1 Tax=Streblomastix strix TaxID=222440 RepID=A0A5J4W4P8_9EUKA|nr:MAG: putative serine:threonine protein kinase ULK2 [Streblomastix strix]
MFEPPEYPVLRQFHLQPVQLLGHGAYGKVYLVQDATRGNQILAAKVLPIRNFNRREWDTANEMRLQCKNLDYLTQIYQMYQSQSDVIIVMEFVNMSGLDAFEKKNGACGLPLTIVRKMMWQILEGIYEMHNVKMIHRDLKDENILMNWSLNVLDNTSPTGFRYASNEQEDMNCEVSMKITDFGLARRLEDNQMAQTHCGTPLNMAPEVLDDQRAFDAKADIWSAGIVFYQLCTSKFPFPAKSIPEMKNMVQRPFHSVKMHPQQQQLPNIQQQYIQLNDLLQKMLCIYPQQRINALAALYHGFFTDEAVNNGRMTLEKYDWKYANEILQI